MFKSKVNKKTASTVNRRVRHVLKRENSKLLEAPKPESNSLPTNFRTNRRSKKGGVKYEEKPTSREVKVDQKVKNWKGKQVVKNAFKKKINKPWTCQKCGAWSESDSCHCNCIQEVSSRILVKEINRRLKKG